MVKSILRLSPWKLLALVGAFACTMLVSCGDDESDVFLARPKADSSDVSSSSTQSSSSSDRYSSSVRSSSSVKPQSNSSETRVSSSSSEISSSSYSSSISVAYVEPCRGEGFDDCEYGTLIDDRDGQSYKTVKIGDVWWMAENLNFAYLWPTANLDSSSFCYENDFSNCEEYGRLYMWSAAMDSAAVYSDDGIGCGYIHGCNPAERVQGVCPQGWHVPTRTEFNVLYESVGGKDAKRKLMTVDEWSSCGTGCTDAYGFSVRPAGHFNDSLTYYKYLGDNALFWSSTPVQNGNSTSTAFYLYLNFYAGFSYYDDDGANRAYSVRCIKDED